MAGTIQDKVRAAALTHGVPVEIALNVARAESGYRQYAADGSVLRSSEGALGVMQLMPATAAWLGVNPADPDQNIDGGVKYLAMLYRQFGSWDLAVPAYNTGPGNLQKVLAGVKALPAETAAYVMKVLGKPFEAIRPGTAVAVSSPPLDSPPAFDWATALMPAAISEAVQKVDGPLLVAAGAGAIALVLLLVF